MTNPDRKQFYARDGMSLVLLGGFFSLLAVLVLLGSFWNDRGSAALVVNIIAGLLLLGIGFGTVVSGRWMLGRAREDASQP